jgi:multidrug efflux pump subunit AcrB
MNRFDRQAEIDFQQSSSNDRFSSSGGGASSQAQRMERMMGMGTKSERVVVKGEDFDMMKQVSEDLEYYLEEMDEIDRVNVSLPRNTPEVHLAFDPELMGRNNITLANISTELNSFKKEIESGFQYKQGNDEYEIIIKTDTISEVQPNRLSDLETLDIESTDGASYELQHISKVYFSSGISRINRVNQEKQVELTIRYNSDINESKELLTAARESVDQLIAGLPLPSGVAIEVIHEEDDYSEYYKLIGIAVLLIYMILASVFESFATPFVLMFSIPLAGIGSLLGLIFTGNALQNANTLTGFLILLGVVVNNGIILIDYANILQKRGYRRTRALMMAGISRLRPILITAITTIVALLPLALGDNEYVGAIGAPFAITVIGGLTISTLLTLVFIPTFYSGLQNALDWFWKLPRWLVVLQLGIYAIGGYFIFTRVDQFLWQSIDTIVLLLIVPAITWFLLSSLRQANETVIPANEPITIRIQNLVKVYDRPGRFASEWVGGRKLRERFGEAKTYQTLHDLGDYTWQLPLLAALVLVYFRVSRKILMAVSISCHSHLFLAS